MNTVSTDNLSAIESAVLVVLMIESREVLNTELVKDYSITLSPVSRKKLAEQLHYITVDTSKKPMRLSLDEAGWARCRRPFDFNSSGAKFNGAALTLLMAAVQRDLERTGRSPAMMFGPQPAATPPAARSVVAHPDLLEQIRLTYKQFATQPGDWVNIADIRETISSVARDDLDAALRELEQQRDVNIVPQANEKALSDRTRDAAVIIGRQHKHFIAIGV